MVLEANHEVLEGELVEEQCPPEEASELFGDIWHPKKKTVLLGYAEYGTIEAGLQAAQCSRQAHDWWMKHDAQYADALDVARRAFADKLEANLNKHALDPNERNPVWSIVALKASIVGDRFRDGPLVDSRTDNSIHITISYDRVDQRLTQPQLPSPDASTTSTQ